MLSTLLRLPTAACRQWADAVGALPPAQLQHVARDPGGCRVLEAYLEVGAGALLCVGKIRPPCRARAFQVRPSCQLAVAPAGKPDCGR